LAVDKPPPLGIQGIMRVIACRRLLLALNVAALILAGMVAGGGAPTAAGMSGMCAHCRAQPAPGHIPVKVLPCAIAACSAAMIVAPAPAQAATPAWSRAEYFAGPTSILSGEAPKADPPPPKSLLVL
jgi:hypothetical protein